MLFRREWLCIAVVLMALSSGIATAKVVDYCIKVTNPTNIRSSYSLDSQIWAMVPAGTVLRVTYEGIQRNWLKVDYLTGSAWIARWLDYSDVNCENQAPAPTPVPASPQPQQQSQPQPAVNGNVDNMCQLGWTCTTELEWREGWHAYRDGQTQQQTQTQPPSQTPGQTTVQTGNQGGELHIRKGTFQLPAGCQETYRFESAYFSRLRISCESSQKITNPVPLSWFSCDAYVGSRSAHYSEYSGTWHTTTSYWCD